jgi:single-strand DNA-binding protein
MSNLNLNKVVLSGRLTSKPELKVTPSGINFCSFSIAIKRRGAEESDFINCQAWRKTAEFISQYFDKGSAICVTGSIQTRSWNDNNGNKRYATEVVVDEAMFVDSRSGSQNAPQSTETRNPYQVPNLSSKIDMSDIKTDTDQDLPF